MHIKNLSQLKRALVSGAEFEITQHCRPEYIGQLRKVNISNTQGFYSIVPNDPRSKVSTANCGKGSWLSWRKSSFWSFDGEAVSVFTSPTDHSRDTLIMRFKVLP